MTRTLSSRLRAAALVGAAAIAASSLVACSGDKKESAPNTLTLLSSFTSGEATGKEFNTLAQKFTEQTGIKIDVQEVNTNDIAGTYESSKLANKERDLVILNLTPATSDWLPQGQVVDVKKYLDDWGLTAKIEPKALEYWTQDGQVAGVPFIGFNWPIWYNMDLFKKAGIDKVPATVDELIADAKALRAKKIQPMALGGGDWPVNNFVTWMMQQYAKPEVVRPIFEKGGYCTNPDVVKGLDLLGRLRDEGVFIDNAQGYTADQMTSAYFAGKAAMMPSGSWSYTTAAPEVAAATELSGLPTTPGGVYAKPTAFKGYNAGFFLSPNGEKKLDQVKQLMQFMYAQEQLQSWAGDASQILAATPAAIGQVKATNPLSVKGTAITSETVDFLLLPDNYIPSTVDIQPVSTAFLGKKGQTGAEFCKALDKLYVDK
jgi:multiple sugar transport system substrate-binding protein